MIAIATHRPPSFSWFLVFAFGVSLLVARLVTGCTPPLTPAETKSIAADGVTIAKCQMAGRMCRDTDAGDCFGAYDDCILDAGLREGSAR